MQYEAQNKVLENTQMLCMYMYVFFIYLFCLQSEKKTLLPGDSRPPIDNRVANNDNGHYIELFAQSMKM